MILLNLNYLPQIVVNELRDGSWQLKVNLLFLCRHSNRISSRRENSSRACQRANPSWGKQRQKSGIRVYRWVCFCPGGKDCNFKQNEEFKLLCKYFPPFTYCTLSYLGCCRWKAKLKKELYWHPSRLFAGEELKSIWAIWTSFWYEKLQAYVKLVAWVISSSLLFVKSNVLSELT